jgi:hypothetical protein
LAVLIFFNRLADFRLAMALIPSRHMLLQLW